MKLKHISKFFESNQNLYEELPRSEFHKLVRMNFFTENKDKFTNREVEEVDKLIKSLRKGFYTRIKGDGLLIQRPYPNPETIIVDGEKKNNRRR